MMIMEQNARRQQPKSWKGCFWKTRQKYGEGWDK